MKTVPSIEQLRVKNPEDGRKVLNLYREWDNSARKKDFESCERYEKVIGEVHKRNGIRES